jgi:hypothetical protein
MVPPAREKPQGRTAEIGTAAFRAEPEAGLKPLVAWPYVASTTIRWVEREKW